MPRSSRRLRRRPSTPDLNSHQSFFTADPASPPETPTTSPQFSRKISLKPRHQIPFHELSPSLADDPNIKPVGNGHQFSYQPTVGPEQLSPRSSSASSVAVDESADDGSSDRDGVASLPNAPNAPDAPSAPSASYSRFEAFLTRQTPTESESSEDGDDEDGAYGEEGDGDDESEEESDFDAEDSGHRIRGPAPVPSAPTVIPAVWEIRIEEVDPMDDGIEVLEVLHPYEIDETSRARAGSWHKDLRDLDRSMMRDLRNLNCSNEASDNEPELDLEEELFLKRQQELRRIRRVSMSSSVGKRTHSELSDSDDEFGPLDVNDVGSSARRMRKRLHRSSLLFNDPPEQIEELEEPNSSDDDVPVAAGLSLAQELPYWTMEIIELESS